MWTGTLLVGHLHRIRLFIYSVSQSLFIYTFYERCGEIISLLFRLFKINYDIFYKWTRKSVGVIFYLFLLFKKDKYPPMLRSIEKRTENKLYYDHKLLIMKNFQFHNKAFFLKLSPLPCNLPLSTSFYLPNTSQPNKYFLKTQWHTKTY